VHGTFDAYIDETVAELLVTLAVGDKLSKVAFNFGQYLVYR
jgi:hypothetical protein